MFPVNCDHEWRKDADAANNINGHIPTIFRCEVCQISMSASEVFSLSALETQTETLRHLKGFQARMTAIAVLISLLALMVSVFFKK